MNIIEANDIRPGDKVQVVPWKLFEEITRSSPQWDTDEYRDNAKDLFKNCGYVWKYVRQNSLGVHLESVSGLVDRSITVPESAILGHAFEYGECVEVTNHKTAPSFDFKHTAKRLFSCYDPAGRSVRVKTGVEISPASVEFRYARPIRKETRTITLNLSEVYKGGLTNKKMFWYAGPYNLTETQFNAVVDYITKLQG